MDLTSLLAAGRAAHEELMVDTVRLQRPGADVYNPVTGVTTRTDPRALYTGRGRVKPAVAVAEDAEVGERNVVRRRYEVALPWSAAPLAAERVLPGDQVAVTASPDPRLVGMVLTVTSVGESATATAWRLSAEERGLA
jgi:hypothetical protein